MHLVVAILFYMHKTKDYAISTIKALSNLTQQNTYVIRTINTLSYLIS